MSLEDAKKQDKRNRTTARSKYKRSYNALLDHMDDRDVLLQTLKDMFATLDSAYMELEETSGQYLTYFESDDDEVKESNDYLEDAYRNRCELQVKLSKRSGSPRVPTNMHVKKLDAPKFSGGLRNFPIFVKDYVKYMEPTFGEDAYALRNCLSGKALGAVSGVDDDYNEM